MMQRVVFVSLLLLFASWSATARADGAADLVAADSARGVAMVAADVAALERMLADELTYVHSTGVVDSKPRLLEELRTSELRYRSISGRDVKARLYGSSGVIVGVASVEVEKGGMARALTLRYTATYVRRDGRWQLVAYQSTLMPAAAEPVPAGTHDATT